MEIFNLQVEYCIIKTIEKNSKCIGDTVFCKKKKKRKKSVMKTKAAYYH